MNMFNMNDIGFEHSCTDINGSFLFSQLLLYILIQRQISPRDRDKFVKTFARIYKGHAHQLEDLEDFNIHYREEDAFEWYTKGTFIFLLLNKTLRTQNMDFLFLFSFFIRDLQKQLELNRCSEPVHVYRGQLMSKSELSHLRQSIGQLISMNSFLSTSLSRDIALSFNGMTDVNINETAHNFECVLFEIDADPTIDGGAPAFANIGDFSVFDEEEILFALGSVFRLKRIDEDPTNPKLTIVSMTLCGNNDHVLRTVLEVMKREYQENGSEPNDNANDSTLMSLGIILLNGRYFKRAKGLLTDMLRTLKRRLKWVDAATCCRYIGDVYRQENRFKTSRKWYRKALKMYADVLPNDHELVAKVYICLGHTYSQTTDWKFPTWYGTDLASK